jgi:hypothetical protein
MRRRPIAIYRVIDEDELLGGEALDGFHDASDRVADRAAMPWPAAVRGGPPRLAAWTGWLPTVAAVGGLVCVAVLLLGLSHHGEPSTAAALARRRSQSPHAPAVPRRAAERASRPKPRAAGYRRPLRPHTGPASKHRSPRSGRGARRRTARPDVALSVRTGEESPPAIASASGASAANQEFGFER